MKTLHITAEMTPKESAIASGKFLSELEDNEPFKKVEEMTLEKFRESLQGILDALLTGAGEVKVTVSKVTFDDSRGVLVIEQVFTPLETEEKGDHLI